MPRFIICLALAGCAAEDGDQEGRGANGDGGTDTSTQEQDSGSEDSKQATGCAAMDVLFVIDDSGSMECEQEMLGKAFPRFIEVIEAYRNENADIVSYRVGVISTGLSVTIAQETGAPPPSPEFIETEWEGRDGVLVEAPGSDLRWIDGPGGELPEKFAAMARLGSDGPGYEMPLEALKLALDADAPGGINEGFLRDDALFVAVIITDEDDCSRRDDPIVIAADEWDLCSANPKMSEEIVSLGEYKAFLDSRFGAPDRYAVVAIGGQQQCAEDPDYPVACPGDSYPGAEQAKRLLEFIDQHVNAGEPRNGLFADICTKDMAQALDEALGLMTTACSDYAVAY